MLTAKDLRNDLIKNHWMWNYTWRGVRLGTLEKRYEVPASEILTLMREIAKEYEPLNAEKLAKMANSGRCDSCGMRIVWGRQNGKPHSLDPRVLVIVTDAGKVERGRESHFVSCPNASEHRKGKNETT